MSFSGFTAHKIMTATPLRIVYQFCLTVCLIFSGLVASATAPTPDLIETIGKSATEWVKLRTETVRLKSDWASQREILESTVTALEQRAKDLEDQRTLLQAKSAKDREEHQTIETKNKVWSGGLDELDARLIATKDRLLQFRSSLPPRLSAALEMPYRSLSGSELAPSDRMQLAITILNRCVQFNRLISLGEEVLTVEGESAPRSLEVIYWGLSHAYALDRAVGKAWLGTPGPQGWHWVAHPEAAKQVTQIIAIYEGKADPTLISVPALLSHVSTESLKK